MAALPDPLLEEALDISVSPGATTTCPSCCCLSDTTTLRSRAICPMSGRATDVAVEAAGVLLLHCRGSTMDTVTISTARNWVATLNGVLHDCCHAHHFQQDEEKPASRSCRGARRAGEAGDEEKPASRSLRRSWRGATVSCRGAQ